FFRRRWGGQTGRSRLLAAAGPTALAQLHPGLGEHPVDETVGTAGRGRKSPDALPGGVPLDEVLGERPALSPDHPAPPCGAGGGAGGCHLDSLTSLWSGVGGPTY